MGGAGVCVALVWHERTREDTVSTSGPRAINSVARVSRLHRESRGFESLIAHHDRLGLDQEGPVTLVQAHDGEPARPLTGPPQAPGEDPGAVRMPALLDGQGPDVVAPQERPHAPGIERSVAEHAKRAQQGRACGVIAGWSTRAWCACSTSARPRASPNRSWTRSSSAE